MAQISSPHFEERWWNLAIFATSFATGGIVLISLIMGHSVLFTHLLYIPIVLVSYRYEGRGVYFASLVGLLYLAADVFLTGSSLFYIIVAAGRAAMFIIIAWVVASLSRTLQEEESLYRETIDSSKDAIFVVDRSLTPLLFNRGFFQWCEKIGIHISKSPWNTPLFEILPFIPPSLQTQYGWVFVTGRPYHKEERFKFDGREVVTEIQLTPILQGDEVERVLTVVRDITDRKSAEEAVRSSEYLYHTIFDTTGTATFIMEDDGSIALANRECELLFGYPLEEMEGKKNLLDLIAKEDRLRLKSYLEKRRTGSESDPPRVFEARCIDADGILRDSIITVGLIPETRRRVVSVLDITARKQAERLILTANSINQMIVHEENERDLMHKACRELSRLDPHLVVSIAICDEGVLVPVAISDERYLALNEVQLARPWVLEAIESRSVNLDVDLVIQRNDGVEFIEHAFAIPMVVSNEARGVVIAYLFPNAQIGEQEMESLQTLANDLAFAIRSFDIEEQKRVALIQIEKNMEQLAIINDSIRNPLQGIVGVAELEGDGMSERITPYVHEIDALINKLDVGWVESEKIREFLRKHYGISEGKLREMP